MRRELASILIAVAAIAGGARLSLDLPGTDVPQTAQTLAVVATGILLGWRRGALATGVYLMLGVLGLPVFAGGTGGLGRLVGPTGGFLVGFIGAATIAGWWTERGWGRSFGFASVGMALAQIEILTLGWLWLAVSIGPERAFSGGVQPFLVGGLVKTVLAAGIATWVAHHRERSPRSEV